MKKSTTRPMVLYGLLAAIALAFLAWNNTKSPTPENQPVTPAEQQQTGNSTPTSPTDSEENEDTTLPAKVLISGTSFISQAPFGDWSDPRQQDGCEEASILIAGSWAHNQPIGGNDAGLQKILALSAMAEEMFGTYHDSSAADTLKLYRKYWNSTAGTVKYDIQLDDIKRALAAGNVVIVPANGKAIGNPNFSGGGPDRHMLVIIGYDDATGMFTTQEPGTRRGANYRYTYSVMMNSIRDYVTGDHLPIPPTRTAMITIPKA